MGEIAQVGRYVQGESVHGDVARGAYAERTDLAGRTGPFDPDPGGAFDASAADAVVGYRVDDHPFDRVDIVAQGESDAFQIKNRIADDLAGSVESDVAATVDVVEIGTDLTQVLFADQQVLRVAAFAQRIDGRMLDQKQISRLVRRLALVLQKGVKKRSLVVPASLVVHLMEIPVLDKHRQFTAIAPSEERHPLTSGERPFAEGAGSTLRLLQTLFRRAGSRSGS